MKRLLYVLPDLEYNGAARQLLYLATGLPHDRFELRVCVLGKAGPWTEDLKRIGVPVQVFGWSRTLDAMPLVELRKTIRAFRPDVIHAWRMVAARALLAAAFGTGARVVLSSVLPSASPSTSVNLLDRWLLRRADRILAGTQYEAHTLHSLGLATGQIAHVPHGVAPVLAPEHASLRAFLGLKPDRRLLACVGPLESEKGFRDAVWALDILHFVFDDVHLLFVGNGPAQAQLQHFARVLTMREFVHFLGSRENVPALLAEVDMVWVPSHRNTGVNAALEAMAAGRPVVATEMPVLMELLPAELRTQAVATEDQGSLARQTRLLLDNPDRCVQLGEAGRQYVIQHHSIRGLIERCTRLYEEIAK